MNSNPLLQDNLLPPFSKIENEHIETAISSLIDQSKSELEAQLNHLGDQPSWSSLVEPLEARSDRLSKAWSPVSHMHSVVNNDGLREAYQACIGKLTEYSTGLGQNEALFNAYQQLAEGEQYEQLSAAQKSTIEQALRDFKLAGVSLSKQDKARFGEIKSRLSELSTQFSNNVMDANQAWYFHTEDEAMLVGLPQMQRDIAKQSAETKSLSGFVLTLDIPSYLSVMQYADRRDLRETLYRAYVSRASENTVRLNDEEGPWDNAPLIAETLQLRHQLAELLGFSNYAELSIARKMAKQTDEVVDFLRELASSSRKVAEQDLKELQEFAAEQGLQGELQAWDLNYYGEKLKQEKFDVSDEALRPYFPAPVVIKGLFDIVHKLFDIEIFEEPDADLWHEDVKFFRIEKSGQVLARFYLDLYAREHKRGGAWMDECRVRRQTENGLQLPVAYLVCNFTAPVGDKPALLSHDEVTTLFHEFGHGLHHMLTEIDVAAVSGINGVPWDAVELPSQFLENWCWQAESIAMISSHYETGESLPQDMLDKLLAAKNFQAGLQMLRQIEFALFDFLLHKDYQANSPEDPQAVLNKVRDEIALIKPPTFNKFQNGFSHIFAGGYAAGYYSYKWAEVLSADAFSYFEEKGIFSAEAGQWFLETILSRGGSEDIADLYERFRGRAPSSSALLRHNGMA
ncbi:M3 family metallopeptidase [Pseudoteredinibacter isoporae]|uniref:oligopeptidase A n=1 Tax=Pseudoteredinibacter isoporae TaxID=570281 RepID=A0A7X0JQW8_9GAMM|nr:M3 family metallopeptidase [Pseudoteredinibacter isoporae]MBB6520139.1 oligopeptidase A [Pseudoteredinibacter isoporae]NHO85711.1 M3 family metallopeptidase [Pseudoteredinibacter isoporae]NIB25837.1 M3 family metallopeptidase [Pseudoteredinibacter isoporae]